MQLSPKAIRFIIEAIEFYQAHHREKMSDAALSEDEFADLGNDHAYYEAIKSDLQEHHDAMMNNLSS